MISIILTLLFYFIIDVYVKNNKKKFKGGNSDWLFLHKYVGYVEFFSSSLLMIIMTIPLLMHYYDDSYFIIYNDTNARGIITIYSFLSVIFVFRYIKRMENIFGLEYVTNNKYSLLGVYSFSDVAYYYLQQNKQIGIKFLQVSLIMLKGYLSNRNLKLDQLDQALQIVYNEELFRPPNYDSYMTLAKSCSNKCGISEVIISLNTFVNEPYFKDVKELDYISKNRKIYDLIKNPNMISLIVGILILIPEEYKPSIIKSVFNAMDGGLLIIIIFCILIYYVLNEYSIGMYTTKLLENISDYEKQYRNKKLSLSNDI